MIFTGFFAKIAIYMCSALAIAQTVSAARVQGRSLESLRPGNSATLERRSLAYQQRYDAHLARRHAASPDVVYGARIYRRNPPKKPSGLIRGNQLGTATAEETKAYMAHHQSSANHYAGKLAAHWSTKDSEKFDTHQQKFNAGIGSLATRHPATHAGLTAAESAVPVKPNSHDSGNYGLTK